MIERSTLIAHLPYLRRYSRALFGSAEAGDAQVKKCLQHLLESKDLWSDKLDPKVALFACFDSVINGLPEAPGTDNTATPESTPDRYLQLLTTRDRQALLLHELEGFTHDEISTILGDDIFSIKRAIEAASDAIEQQTHTSILIIEDEPIIAMDIESTVTDMGHRVVGCAATHAEAVGKADEFKPGLILADIRLADGSSGIEAVQEILQSYSLPVIFITAYPELLLTGDTIEPTYVIAKPFSNNDLRVMISQVMFLEPTAHGCSV